jgi:hypothetical protein
MSVGFKRPYPLRRTQLVSRSSTSDPMHARSDNSLCRILRIACWVVISVCQVFAVDPVVSRVQAQAKQREGSRMVDSTCDVASLNLKYSFAL